MTVLFDAVEGLDSNTVTHDAYGGNTLTRDAGDFLLSVLYTRDTASETASQTAGDWVADLTTFIGTFTSPYRFLFGNYRPRCDLSSDDALSWEWVLGSVEASALVLAAHGRYDEWQSDYNDNSDATVDTSIGSAEGVVTVLFLISAAGTTCNGDLIIRSDGASMPAGHGYVEAWAYQGPGPHTVDADAVSGNIVFYYWVELAATAVMQVGPLAMKPE